MNKLTIVFLQELYDRADCKDEIEQYMISQLNNLMDQYISYYGVDTSLLMSADANRLCDQLINLQKSIFELNAPVDSRDIISEMQRIFSKLSELEAATSKAIFGAGKLNPDDIHIITAENQLQALNRIVDEIRLQEYLAVIYGTEEFFAALPAIRSIEGDIHTLFKRFASEVFPQVDMLAAYTAHPIWSFARNDILDDRSTWSFPIFVPDTCSMEVYSENLVGPHNLNFKDEKRIQGRGRVTNITPLTIEDAQEKGICWELPDAVDYKSIDGFSDLNGWLSFVFRGRYYSISPYDVIVVLNRYLLMSEIRNRKDSHRCLLCAKRLREKESVLCNDCKEKA